MYDRSKPHKTNSLQAKRHLGLSLFCAKKPPKTGNNDNELTHHQHSHKNNIIDFHCHESKKEFKKQNFCLKLPWMIRHTSVHQLVQVCLVPEIRAYSNQLMRAFPGNYLNMIFLLIWVNVTPSTYRIMTKQVKQIDDTQETEILTDACNCFVRPKCFLGSSGSVWTSEFMHLRYEEPHKFDVSYGENSSDSKEFKISCIILNDALNLYLDSTEKSDILSV